MSSAHSLLVYQLLSSYQTCTVLSIFCRPNKPLSCSQLLLSTHHINMYPLYATHTQLCLYYQPGPAPKIQAANPCATRGLVICFPVEVTVERIGRARGNTLQPWNCLPSVEKPILFTQVIWFESRGQLSRLFEDLIRRI